MGPLEDEVGHLDVITRNDSTVRVVGWAPWEDREIKDHTLYVLCDRPIRNPRVRIGQRIDVAVALDEPGYLFSGFLLEFEIDGPGIPPVCLIMEDPEGRRFLLVGDKVSPHCVGLLESRRP